MKDFDLHSKNTTWIFIIFVLAVFALAVLYFGRNNPDLLSGGQAYTSKAVVSREPRSYTVFYGSGVFSPTNIRIHVGDSVKFQNDSKTPLRVISDYTSGVPNLAGFDSVADIPAKGIFNYTFNQSGIFGYHNAYTQSEEGTVIVRP